MKFNDEKGKEKEKDLFSLKPPTSSTAIILYSIASTTTNPHAKRKIQELAREIEDRFDDQDKTSELMRSSIKQWFIQVSKIFLTLRFLRNDLEEFSGLTEVNTSHMAGMMIRLDDLDQRFRDLEEGQKYMIDKLELIINKIDA